ncbi:MAG: DUF4838 domain-containing protein [Planctomycetes bacterium]|nr:DUF4838 domain-containing protein [Planctomycetota bacterium]
MIGCATGLAIAVLLGGSSGDAVVLVEGGSSRHRIVLEPSASGSEKHAAIEIREHLKACTDATLPIITGAPPDDGSMIVLGRGPIAASLGVAPSDEELGEQGFVLRTAGEHIVIAGTARAGTLHGARRFLEQALGIRWYAPGVTRAPRRERLVVGPLDLCARPAFRWRAVSYAWPGGDEEFRARRGLNSGGGGADDPQGEQYSFDGTCHSYFAYVSPDEFFDAHPEYFSEVNGRRIRDETQLCLTNPDVLEIVAERMLARMEARPHDRQHNFSQMDWYNPCECERCRAINARYGTNGGTQFWFVNRLAERTSAVHPEKRIGTLAYTYTEEPPRGMAMHPNVAVWLCHMFPSCDSHPIETCPRNADYRRRAEAWSRICSHLYIWHYVVDFAHYYNPFPNFRALAADMRFYRRLGVEGVFAQAMGHAGGGGEFSLLRGYYVSELLEDPDRDPGAIIRDFLEGYYGPASRPIDAYIALLHDKVRDDDIHMHLYTNPARGYLTDDVMDRAEALFDEAEAAARDDETLLERVRVARMPLVYARFFPRNGYRIEGDRLIFRGPLAGPTDAQAFVARMARHGFRTIREQGGDPAQLVLLAGVLNAPLPLVTLRNEHLRVDLAPFLGGRVLRIIDRRSGRSATSYDNARNLLFPFCGGEETRIGGLFTIESGGSIDPAIPVDVTDHSATLAATLRLGYRVERTIALVPDRPAVSIRVQATNISGRPQSARIRSHLSLDPGDVGAARIRFTDRGGARVDTDLARAIAGLREGERFLRDACPDGSWTFTGTNGLSVTQRFDPGAVDYTWVCAYPADLNELEIELWGGEKPLLPGESATFEHELEIGRSAPLSYGGIYPHLAVFNDRPGEESAGETGIGAIVPWASRLWAVTYSAHKPGGSGDKLYEIDPSLRMAARPESVGGTPANRLIHRETNQLIIGPYVIDAKGGVRAIAPQRMFGRPTATTRHLTDTANKVYVFTMEEGLYEVDLRTLSTTAIFEDRNRKEVPDLIPGNHGKGAYVGQGRLVVSNNGEASWRAGSDRDPAGCLAEWDGSRWTVIARHPFTEVSGPGGIEGARDPSDPIWAIGWDARSAILMVRDAGRWHRYRLPKASYTYDARHGWYTEWPRIREIDRARILMTLHGMFWDMPRTFRTGASAGLRPRSAYLRIIADFCAWNDRVVFACDDTSTFGNPLAGRSQSNLWFVAPGRLDDLGPPAGSGGVWLDDPVAPGAPSDPFIFDGFDRRMVHIWHNAPEPVDLSFEVDRAGDGTWTPGASILVPPARHAHRIFPAEMRGAWVRIRAGHPCRASAFFHVSAEDPRRIDARPALFDAIPRADEAAAFSLGWIRPRGAPHRSLHFAARISRPDGSSERAGYYEIDEDMVLRRVEDPKAEEWLVETAKVEGPVFSVDAASVIVAEGGRRFRLPKGHPAFDAPFSGSWPRGIREVVTERSLLNVHGTFYELPRPESGGMAKIKPVCTHDRRIVDFCSWRGMLVLAGTRSAPRRDGFIPSDDGKVGLWFGTIDDLWVLGKPHGRGGPWSATPVRAGEPSDPYLMAGYDRKRLEISHDAGEVIRFAIEVDPTGRGDWGLYDALEVPPGETVRHAFPEGYAAHWVRLRASRDARATAIFTYE